MAQTAPDTAPVAPKPKKAPTLSHAIPFHKNALAVGSVVSAVMAIANSKLALVSPPWLLWGVVGLLVAGWIWHTVAVDRTFAHGAISNSFDPFAWLPDLLKAAPDIVKFLEHAKAAHAPTPAPTPAADAKPAAADGTPVA
jgi:hypothetical protein